jgi:hypothetical protein
MRRKLLSDMPNAGACLGADRLGLRPTDTNTPAKFSGVELRTADQVALYKRQSPPHTTVLPIERLNLEMGHPVDSVHGEIRAVSLQWTPYE